MYFEDFFPACVCEFFDFNRFPQGNFYLKKNPFLNVAFKSKSLPIPKDTVQLVKSTPLDTLFFTWRVTLEYADSPFELV